MSEFKTYTTRLLVTIAEEKIIEYNNVQHNLHDLVQELDRRKLNENQVLVMASLKDIPTNQ